MVYGLVAPGYEMADVVAANLTGRRASSPASTCPPSSSSWAWTSPASATSFAERRQRASAHVRRPVRRASTRSWCSTRDGTRLLGGVLVGDASEYGTLLGLFKSGKPLPVPPGELLLVAPATAGAAPRHAAPTPRSARATTSARARSARPSATKKLTTVAEVKSCTKAGTGCGGCLPQVTDLLKAELKAIGQDRSTTTSASTSRTAARSCSRSSRSSGSRRSTP